MNRSVYRPPPALAGRGVGVGAIALGVAVVGLTLITAADLDGVVRAILLALVGLVALLGLTVLVVGIVRLAGRGARLVLDDDGFLNATGPGAGARRGSWTEVRKVQTDGSVVSIDLSGSRQSIIRTRALGIDPAELARDIRARVRR